VAWGEELLAELVEVLIRPEAQNGFGWSLPAAEAVAGYVRAAFPDGNPAPELIADQKEAARALVRDPEDDHVVALALSASADHIITANTRDFRAPQLLRHGITLTTPDRFLLGLQHGPIRSGGQDTRPGGSSGLTPLR
jgi:predicted nucleic acid-binding protein